MKKLSLPLVSLFVTSALGAASSAALAAESPLTISSTTVSNLRVYEAIPQNTDQFSKILKVRVLLGGNPCTASASRATLEAKREGGNLVLKPRLLRTMRDEPRVCTTEWRPVTADYEFEIQGAIGQYRDIVVENVQTETGVSAVSLGSLQ
ncbi:MAG: hypothetical protein RIQ81_2231 [Pseudomonadota bacterium]